jgi:choice-of-anchor B domain-containing protein
MTKDFILFFFLLLTSLCVEAQTQMKLYATWDDPSLPTASPDNLKVRYSGCWGMAVNGREYAVLGGAAHILIFDVTDPNNTFLRKKYARPGTTVWREFKSYKNRLYAVTDGVDEGLTIYDFSQAPDTIIETYSSTSLFNRSHSITLDSLSGHIYLNGGSSGNGITILSVAQNPDQPQLITKIPELAGGYIHDSYVRNDTLFASSGYSGFYVYDFKTDIMNPKVIASVSTGGYNHNSWTDKSGRYAYYTEEIPKGRPIQIVDMTKLTTTGEIELLGNGFLNNLVVGGTEAIPHNVYIKDNLLFDSQYEDGLLVYDITNPTTPVLKYVYDTHPQNTIYNGYRGNWGSYPWLPSGIIVAGDMQNGLFILGLDGASSTLTPNTLEGVRIAPNPATDEVLITCPENIGNWQYDIYSITGQNVRSALSLNTTPVRVTLQGVVSGLYFVTVRAENGTQVTQKLMIR